jgi:hypothetical protein
MILGSSSCSFIPTSTYRPHDEEVLAYQAAEGLWAGCGVKSGIFNLADAPARAVQGPFGYGPRQFIDRTAEAQLDILSLDPQLRELEAFDIYRHIYSFRRRAGPPALLSNGCSPFETVM